MPRDATSSTLRQNVRKEIPTNPISNSPANSSDNHTPALARGLCVQSDPKKVLQREEREKKKQEDTERRVRLALKQFPDYDDESIARVTQTTRETARKVREGM